MTSASSWITSLSCSSTSAMPAENDTSHSSSILSWLQFILLSPCPQRLLLASINTLFLFTLFVFALQKLYSRFTSHDNSINEPLIAKNTVSVKTSLWFKLSQLVSGIVAVLAIISSILGFTQDAQKTPWRVINGSCWLIQAISFVTIAVLIIHQKRFRAETHPVSLRVFWVLNFIAITLIASSSIIRLVSNTPLSKTGDVIASICLPFSAFFLIPSLTGSTGITVTTESKPELRKSSNATGWASASIFSRTFWLWLNPLLKKGYKTPLTIKDIPSLSPQHRADRMLSLFEQNWPRPEEKSKHPVRTTLLRCFWKDITFIGFLAIIKLGVVYVGPLLIQRFVDFTSGERNSPFEGFYLVLILLVAKLVEVLSSHHFNFHSQKLGMSIRSTLITSLYKKGLRLSCSARQSHGVGQIVNYMVVDAQQLSDVMLQLHAVWLLPCHVLVSLVILYGYLGLSTVITLIAVLVILLFVFWGTKRNNRYQFNIMMNRDSRMKATNEMLSDMRVIKFQAWEEHFNKRIQTFRESEYGWLCKFMYSVGANMIVLWSTPLLISTVTFGSTILLGIKFDAGTVFTKSRVLSSSTFRARRLHTPTMGHSNVWNSHPKTYGPGSRTCRVCGNSHGLIRKYGLMCCRQCFHSNAKEIGFIKYR